MRGFEHALGFIIAITLGGIVRAAATFEPLGDLPGGVFRSGAAGVSHDGSTVVGSSTSEFGTEEAFRWTRATGMQALGDLSGGTFYSIASGVSSDGSVVVGQGTSTAGQEAFRWSAGGGMQGLGDLPGLSFQSNAIDVSGDGTIVVGFARGTAGTEAVRWVNGGAAQGLGDLPGGSFRSDADGISRDGLTIVGSSSSSLGSSREMVRWTAGGMQPLGDLDGGIFDSAARATNHDGSVIVGFGSSAASSTLGTLFEACRWTASGGMEPLGDLPGGNFSSFATAVSDDGSTVLGIGETNLGQEAFIWTELGGMRNLEEWLAIEHGLQLPGWTLNGATGISGDGTVMVGGGKNPQGHLEAWRVIVPEPTGGLLITLAAVFGMLRRRRTASTCMTHVSESPVATSAAPFLP